MFEVSIILDADEDIQKTLGDLRESLGWLSYEFIVVDRGTKHRAWLAQQGDTQAVFLNDDRPAGDLPIQMARYCNLLILEGGEFQYRENVPKKYDRGAGLDKRLAISHEPIVEKPIPERKTDRWLHISSFPSNTEGITSALEKFGEVECFNWQERLQAVGREKMNKELLTKIRYFRPGTIFMEEGFNGDVLPETLSQAKSEESIGVINWCGDIRDAIPQSMVKMGPVVDWTMLSNEAQVRELLRMDIQAAFLAAGCSTDLYKRREPDNDSFPEDIIFLGSGGRRFENSALRLKIVLALRKRYGDRFGVYGRGWRKRTFPWVKRFIEPAEREAIAYSSCKIAIGISAFSTSGYTSARMWKAMASGACYLPHYFDNIERWFKPQQEVAWWRTLHELIAHIDYYLSRENERTMMANRGMDEVRNNHSWESRMRTAVRILRGRKIKVFDGAYL